MRDPRTIIAGIGLAATAAAAARTARAPAGRTTEAILLRAQAVAASAPGSLDPTFGNGGKALTPGGGATGAILQPKGDIRVSTGSGVARFLPTGKLDTTFGSGGQASAGFTGGEGLQGIALQPDGKIIWGGRQDYPG